MAQVGGLGRKYLYARDSQVFAVTPAQGVQTTGQTSFVATTPTFLIAKTDGSSTRTIPLSALLGLTGTQAGGAISVAVYIDSTDRYSSDGTALVIKPMAMGGVVGPGFRVYSNATASAASDAVRRVAEFTISSTLEIPLAIDFEGEVQIGQVGSILIYTWAATTGPTWSPNFVIAEERLT